MAVDGRAWMALFLVAAGCSDRAIAEDEEVERADVECDIAVACGDVQSEEGCSDPLPADPCFVLHRDKLAECIEQLGDHLDEIEAAMGEEREALCSNTVAPACSEVYTVSNRPECFSETTIGRPLHEGHGLVLPEVVPPALLAATTPDDARARAGRYWLEAARMEHASVSAFARLSTELMALAAPADLVARTHEAALDEIRHAQRCLAVAGDLLNTPVELGALPVVPARRDVSLTELALEAFVEGCLGEAIAAAEAQSSARDCMPEIAALLTEVAADELRHAALAWSIVGWALRRDPTLAAKLFAAADTWRTEIARRPIASRPAIPHLGVPSGAESRTLALQIADDIVRPTLARLATAERSATTPVLLAVDLRT